ncbi:HK97 family phage prohead protease [Enterovibrio calviensis]|uniref:HK97 family phage prohead protease n=1 Tax=Enterovibrio calviensis TaxID=91359 RepID=UPI0006871C7F|nr:HK97 family phage prohead protease [Enterovibrio calviensis]
MSLKTLSLQIKSFDSIEDEEGVFIAYANVKNVVDRVRDCTIDGCFDGSVKRSNETGKFPKMLLQHDYKQVCGVWLEMVEDDYGLKVKGKLALNTTIGRETYELLKIGALDALSIGYNVKREFYDKATKITFLQEVDVREVSIVTFPCNDESLIESVKSEDIARAINEAEEPTQEETEVVEDTVEVPVGNSDELPDELTKRLNSLVLNIKAKAA